MLYQAVSDFHMRPVDKTALLEIAAVPADVCGIAGDVYRSAADFLHNANSLAAFLEENSPNGKLYIVGGGNHDFYKSNKQQMDRMMGHCLQKRPPLAAPGITQDIAKKLPAGVVFAAPRLDITYLGVRFIYTPGWWDGSLFPLRKGIDEGSINDELLIYDMIDSNYGFDWGDDDREWLDEVTSANQDTPCVVITHTAPLHKSAHPKYAGWRGNCFFVNEWPHIMSKPNVVLWHHGHTHTAFDYTDHGCRVVCNPRGFPADASYYRPNFVVEVPGEITNSV